MTSLDPVVWAAVVAFLPCGAATIEAARLSRDTRAACLAHVARIARRAATAIASPQPACLDRSQGPSLDPLNLRQNPNLLLIPAPPSSPNTQPTLLDVRAVATLHAVLNAVPTALLDTSSNLYALCVGAVLRHLVALIQTECGRIDDSVFGGGDLPRVLCEALRLLRRLLSLYLLDFDRPLPDVTGLADDVLDTVIYLSESLVHWENLGESLLLLAIQLGRKLDAVGPKSNNWSLAGFRAVRIWLTLHRSFQISQTRSQLLNQIAESLFACAAPESPDLDLLTFALARSSREYFLSPVLAACLRSAWSMGGPFRDSAEESLLELAEGVFGEAATDDNAVKGVLQFCMLAVNVMAEDGRTSDTSRLPGLVELPLGLEPMLMSLLMPLMASAEDRVVAAASRRITRALVQHWNTNERVEGKSDRSTEDSFLEFWGRCLEVKEFNFRSKFDIIGLFEILLNYVCTETDRLIAWKLSAHRICQGFTSDQMEAVDVGCYAAATLLEKVLRNDSDAASFSKAVRDTPNCRVQDIVHGINQWCVKYTTKRSDIGASINHFIAAALRFSSPLLLPPVSLDPLMNWIAEKADKTWAEIYARLCLVRPRDHVVVNVTQLLDLIRESQSKIHVNFAAKSLAWIFMNSDWSTTTAVWNRFFLEAWEAMLQAAPVCGLEIVNPITTLARSLRTLNDAEAVFSLTSSFRSPSLERDEEWFARAIGVTCLARYSDKAVVSIDLCIRMYSCLLHLALACAERGSWDMTNTPPIYEASRHLITDKFRGLDFEQYVSCILLPTEKTERTVQDRETKHRSRLSRFARWDYQIFNTATKQGGSLLAAMVVRREAGDAHASSGGDEIERNLSSLSEDYAGEVLSLALRELMDSAPSAKERRRGKADWNSLAGVLRIAARIAKSPATSSTISLSLLELMSGHLLARRDGEAGLGPDAVGNVLLSLDRHFQQDKDFFSQLMASGTQGVTRMKSFARLIGWAAKEAGAAGKAREPNPPCRSNVPLNFPQPSPHPSGSSVPDIIARCAMSVWRSILHDRTDARRMGLLASASCLATLFDSMPEEAFCEILEEGTTGLDGVPSPLFNSRLKSASCAARQQSEDGDCLTVGGGGTPLQRYLNDLANFVQRTLETAAAAAKANAGNPTRENNRSEAPVLLLFVAVPRLSDWALSVAWSCVPMAQAAHLPSDDGSFGLALAERLVSRVRM